MEKPILSLALPKGRLEETVVKLLDDMGIHVVRSQRSYKPFVSDPAVQAKILKPRDVAGMISLGRIDAGFVGMDLVRETRSDVAEVLDTGLDAVRIVAAVPSHFPDDLTQLGREIVAVSEYATLASDYLAKQKYKSSLFRTSGATEVFPPDDADMIIDNCSTGVTLEANRLKIIDTLMTSTTRFVAHPSVLKNDAKRRKIEDLTLLMRSVLEARKRVILEMNVPKDKLEALVKFLPAMKSPTIQPLYQEQGFAVKIAVEKKSLADLIPKIKALGATDILQYQLDKVIP